MDRKLYSIQDITLPMPISLRVLGAFLISGAVWWGILALTGVPGRAPWHILWLGVPGLIAFLASGNFFDKKSLPQYLKARITHILEEKRYKGLERDLNVYDKPLESHINIILPRDKTVQKQ